MTSLPNCPCCGGEAEVKTIGWFVKNLDMTCVGCKDETECGLIVWRPTEAEAIAAWNLRADGWVSIQEIQGIIETLKEHKREMGKVMSPARVPGRPTLEKLYIALHMLEELLDEPLQEGPKQ